MTVVIECRRGLPREILTGNPCVISSFVPEPPKHGPTLPDFVVCHVVTNGMHCMLVGGCLPPSGIKHAAVTGTFRSEHHIVNLFFISFCGGDMDLAVCTPAATGVGGARAGRGQPQPKPRRKKKGPGTKPRRKKKVPGTKQSRWAQYSASQPRVDIKQVHTRT